MIDAFLSFVLWSALVIDPVNYVATHWVVRWTRWVSATAALAYALDRGEHSITGPMLIVCFLATVLANRWAAKRLQDHYDPNGSRARL